MITIQYPPYPGFIVSVSHNNMTISENGRHLGIEYQGIIYCNVHPFGLPIEEWLSDFVGVGIRHITKLPF